MRPCKGADWRDRHIKQYKAREKVTQKMTREGAVEVNAATGKKKRISKRIRDADFAKTEAPQPPEQAAQTIPGGAAPAPTAAAPPLPHAPGAEREQDTAAAERVLERIDGARTRKASKKAARKAQAEATAKEKSSRLQLPTRNGQRRSLKGISENRTKQPTVWTRQGRLSPKKRNLYGSAPLMKPPGKARPAYILRNGKNP